jgi:hypothetical protein
VLALFAGRAQAAPEPPHNAVFALIMGDDDEHPAENSADRSSGRRARSAIVSAWSMQVGLGPTQVNLSARF